MAPIMNQTYRLTDENKGIVEKIQSTDGSNNLDIKLDPMIDVIKRIFSHVNLTSKLDSQSSVGATFEFQKENNEHRIIIHRLSWKIICESACGKNEQQAATELLDLISSYSLEAKVVLVLAAFAMTYGQFCFCTNTNFNSDNHLAQPVCLFLKPLCLFKESPLRGSHFSSLKKLAEKMLAVAVLMVNLKENKNQMDVSRIATTLHFAVYWMITSVYKCLSYNMNLVKMDDKLSTWGDKINIINDCTENLTVVHDHLFEFYQEQEYSLFVEKFDRPHQSVEGLISMFYKPASPLQCIGTPDSRQVGLDYLKGKTVMFFISHLKFDMKYIDILQGIYKSNKKEYEIVWIPIEEEGDRKPKESFQEVFGHMSWSWLCEYSIISRAFKLYIRQQWNFHRKPVLMIVDKKFQVINSNALPMVELIGSFPIYPEGDDKFWSMYRKPIWQLSCERYSNLEQLVQKKVVCFYGGQDDEWVKKFGNGIKPCKTVVDMEIYYLGTGRAKTDTKLQKIITACTPIVSKNPPSLAIIREFWKSLTLLYNIRMSNRKVDLLNDAITEELSTILSYDNSEDGWAIMFGGSSDKMVISGGQQLIQCLTNFTSWGSAIKGPADFVVTMNANLTEIHTEEHCISKILPTTAIKTDTVVCCSICKQPMEKNFIFKCCTK